MRACVIYKSKQGFSKAYAELISKRLNIDIYSIDHLNSEFINKYDLIIYGSGLYAGIISGLKRVKKLTYKHNKRLVIFTTGATRGDSFAYIEKMWRANLKEAELKTIPHFYMQGGIKYEALGFIERHLMHALAKEFYKKDNKNDLRKSCDFTNEAMINSLIAYLKG